MSQPERILLAVDESVVARRAVWYVGRMVSDRSNFYIDLYHRLPALPPELREHGGSEDPQRETELGRELSRQIAQWVRSLEAELQPTLDELKSILTDAGVPSSAVAYYIDEDVFPGESLADALRRAALNRGCRTIALARAHLPGIHEFFHHHASEELIREGEGIAVWVVE